jgi:hypothetical protein
MLYIILIVLGVGIWAWVWALCRIAGESDQIQWTLLMSRNGQGSNPHPGRLERDFMEDVEAYSAVHGREFGSVARFTAGES